MCVFAFYSFFTSIGRRAACSAKRYYIYLFTATGIKGQTNHDQRHKLQLETESTIVDHGANRRDTIAHIRGNLKTLITYRIASNTLKSCCAVTK